MYLQLVLEEMEFAKSRGAKIYAEEEEGKSDY